MRILDKQRTLYSRLSFSAGIGLLALVLLVVPFSGRLAMAQVGEWKKVSETGPLPLFGHNMVYDEARGNVVLFGGAHTGYPDNPITTFPFPTFSDTWIWDGTVWTKVATNSPEPRIDFGMAYDSVREKVVLFGGYNFSSSTYWASTWEWDGRSWTEVATDGPPPRHSTSMVYDSARGKTVLFGGEALGKFLGDTWEWDGAVWTQVSSEGPSSRSTHAMAYDSIRPELSW